MASTTGKTVGNSGESVIGRIAGAGVRAADLATGVLSAAGVPAARALGADRAEIYPHVAKSHHLVDGVFTNPEPPTSGVDADFGVIVDMARRPGRPSRPIPVTRPRFADEAAALSATWLGHASVLVELDGVRVLTDPVFSGRCSPSRLVGPPRMHPSPVAVADLPPIDVVLISHDHYDHLDMETVAALAVASPDAVFVAPVGVAAHLIGWGVPADRIRQADWWQSIELPVGAGSTTLRFTCGPARHFSGRGLTRNLTQWASWAVVGPSHRFFFSGDTGYSERFEDLGERLGPFDLTLIAVGAYDPVWPDIHIDPEEAVALHRMVSGAAGTDSVLIPIHWGTFNLARHPWAEPITRLLPHAARNATTVVVPQPGGTVDLLHRNGTGLLTPNWWEASA
ncbi:MBL fold metallo-hydrolase [Gordonia sp. NPDC003429]